MTAFVLVAGPFTGGWIWREVARRLRESGAEVHPAALTGLGEGGRAADAGTDLETHIEDLLRLIDALDAPELVLVGHDYGIHPVLGAADRRPGRVARIVFLDAGMPQDGDAAVQLVRDEAVREQLLNPAGAVGERLLAPPAGQDWQRWGSTAGLDTQALARLSQLAAAQPVATFTQPLRLSGALAGLPTTGIFCTANGMTTAAVQALVTSGMPQFQALADPQVAFFDLDTGHWPMLSRPDELAEVLRQAGAGEGHRLTAREQQEAPGHLRPFVLEVAQVRCERVGRVDLYLPEDQPEAHEPRPAVVFVHGGPIPADQRPTPRDWPSYVGYGRYAASLGVVGATLDHRLHGLTDYGRAARDIAEAIELVRADPRVDPERVALWFFSGGGLLSAHWLWAPEPWLRCVAASYPVLTPLPGWDFVESRFRPADALASAGELPFVLTRVGLEAVGIAATVETFLAAAQECGAELEVADVPHGRHGFDVLDHNEESRAAIERAFAAVLGHLRT